MSQHILTTTTSRGRKVTVTMGYDRPLDYVFCTVMDADGDVIYSNLCDEMAGTDLQSVDCFVPVLRQIGIDVPDVMLIEVKSDQALRIGNRVEHYMIESARNSVRSPINRLMTAVRRIMMKTRFRPETNESATKGPETLDLLDVIGEGAAEEPEFAPAPTGNGKTKSRHHCLRNSDTQIFGFLWANAIRSVRSRGS